MNSISPKARHGGLMVSEYNDEF